jgi:type III pantothenate kinase
LAAQDISASDLQHAVICSVVPPLEEIFEEVVRRYWHIKPLTVATGIKTGVRVRVDNPREVGADRVANTVAGYRVYGGPLIVVDFGTATTFDVITQEGDYIGGAIAPGLGIAADALFTHAAKLFRVEIVRPRQAIGHNTVSTLQSGLFYGYVGLVEGLIKRLQAEIEVPAKVVATGGLADSLAREITAIDVVNPDLTLIGLRILHEMNQPGA